MRRTDLYLLVESPYIGRMDLIFLEKVIKCGSSASPISEKTPYMGSSVKSISEKVPYI